MAVKKLVLILLVCYLAATQDWINEVKTQPNGNNLQVQTQEATLPAQPTEKKVEVQQQQNADAVQQTVPQQEQVEKYHERQVKTAEKPSLATNPFDRTGAQKSKNINEKRFDSMQDWQVRQEMQSPNDFRKRDGRSHRGSSNKEFRRKPEHRDDYSDNMPLFCFLGVTAVGSALVCCCVKKCKQYSKKSMEKMMRRQQMARFRQIKQSVQHMPIRNQQVAQPISNPIDQQIRFHQIELEKLKHAYEQRNQGYYEDQSIPVGQPVSSANMMRVQEYRY